MRANIAKEFQLVMHPSTYFLVLLGMLVLIPSWPYAVILLYGILMAFFNAQNAREMNDLAYSFALPLTRRDMVRTRILVMMIIEGVMVLIMAIGVCLRSVWGIENVAATQPLIGMPANIAFLGCSLATFGIFNAVFFPLYYRDPLKIGIPFLVSCIPVLLFSVAFEAIPFIPLELCSLVGTPGFAHLPAQLLTLAGGGIIFALLSMLGIALSSRAFASYDA